MSGIDELPGEECVKAERHIRICTEHAPIVPLDWDRVIATLEGWAEDYQADDFFRARGEKFAAVARELRELQGEKAFRNEPTRP